MTAFIFVFGLLVTSVTVSAVGAIWWAAIGDGRRNEAAKSAQQDDDDARAGLKRVA